MLENHDTIFGKITIEYVNSTEFGKIPKKLYKFRNWNDSNHRKTLSIGEIYLSTIFGLNDPFDCKINSDYTLLRDDVNAEKAYWSNYLNIDFPNDSQYQRENRIRKIISHKIFHDQERIENLHKQELEELNKTFGVFSTSLIPDNILMWSHYADNHKGFCIGFDSTKLFASLGGKGMGGAVKYSENYPAVSPLDTTQKKLVDQLNTKASFWNYELEYRVIRIAESTRIVIVPDDAIVEVILGASIDPAHKAEIIMITEKRYPHTKIFQAQLKKDRFGLDLIPL